ncbi:MAG: SDR family NAD(P)-dependent oxidoreductase [Myxococcota bacterium]
MNAETRPTLEGKTAVVTGAAGGIGRASAVRLAQDGADVAILDIDRAGLEETAQKVEATGRRCVTVTVDLLDRSAITAAFEQVRQELGPVDVLHNNAGGSARGETRSFTRAGPETWDAVVDLNLRATADCTRAVVSDMKERRFGRIVHTASEQAYAGGFGFSDYAAAKAGIIGFTRALARELAPFGITVNTVCPGVTRTPALEQFDPQETAAALEAMPMKKFCEASDIAHVVSFFADPASWHITGTHLMATAGRTII